MTMIHSHRGLKCVGFKGKHVKRCMFDFDKTGSTPIRDSMFEGYCVVAARAARRKTC